MYMVKLQNFYLQYQPESHVGKIWPNLNQTVPPLHAGRLCVCHPADSCCAQGALICMGSTPLEVITSWYNGFFNLLAFAMQIALIIVTGSALLIISQGPAIDAIARRISTPSQVYFLVVAIGMFFIHGQLWLDRHHRSFARELAERVKGVHYGFLIACVYFSMNSWVLGLSSTIPLLLNTENNYLIQAGTLDAVIPTSVTLGAGPISR